MDLNRIDFNRIAVFCQVIDSGGYRRAAEALRVTPSALSQTVTGLERSLGFTLFERRGRRLIPNRRGLRLHREFRTRQTGLVDLLREMGEARTQVSGMLRIGAYLEFAKSRLTGRVAAFIREFPEASIRMVFDSPSRLHALLDQGQLDLCFSIFPSSEKKAIRSRALCREELVLIAGRGQLPETPTFEQVLAAPIVDYYLSHQLIRRWLYLHYGKRPKKLPIRVFAATAEMVVSLVREGAGIGVVPRYLVGSPELQRELRIIRPTERKLVDAIWLLEKVGPEVAPVHSMFRERLLQGFAIEEKRGK